MKECMSLLIHIKNQMYSWQIKPTEKEQLIIVSLMVQRVKNPSAMQETCVRSLGWEDTLEEGMATSSSILAWRIPKDKGIWRTAVHEVAKSQTWLST